MARIRSIKPGYGTSEAIACLSLGCELHFAKLWTYCDDHGRAIDNPRLIKGAIWPLRDEVDVHQVADWQDELARAGRIVRYESDGKRYFEVVNWAEHQHPNRPADSEYPAPPPTSGNHEAEQGHVRGSASTVEEHVPGGAVLGGGEVEGDGGGEGTSPRRPPSSKALALVQALPATPVGPSFEDFWQAYPKRNGKRVGKPKTEPRWRRLSLDERQLAMVGAGNYAQAVKAGLTIAKDPERWVRDRCWEDWQEPAQQDKPRSEQVKPKSFDALQRRMAQHQAAQA